MPAKPTICKPIAVKPLSSSCKVHKAHRPCPQLPRSLSDGALDETPLETRPPRFLPLGDSDATFADLAGHIEAFLAKGVECDAISAFLTLLEFTRPHFKQHCRVARKWLSMLFDDIQPLSPTALNRGFRCCVDAGTCNSRTVNLVGRLHKGLEEHRAAQALVLLGKTH